MKRASISEAKNTLSALISGLTGGSSVLIVDRGRPVARLEPVIGPNDSDHDGRLSRLLHDGVIRPRRSAPRLDVFDTAPPVIRAAIAGSDVLIRERREGR